MIQSAPMRCLHNLVLLHNFDFVLLKTSIWFLESCDLLKSYYTRSYSNSQHIEQVNNDVGIVMSNIELTYIKVDDVVTSSNDLTFDEWKYFVKKLSDVNNQKVEFEEIALKQPQLLLLSGIAGIGKTCFFQKCLFCWAKGLLWKNVDLVLYFEFKKLNNLNHVSNPQEMVNKFYKNILKEQYVMSSQMTVMFIIDGLDEFVHLEHLYSDLSGDCSNIPIVSTLVNVLSARNIKCVLGGRVEAVMKYQNLVKGHENISHIQIMGFSDFRIREYCESNLISKNLKSDLQEFIKNSPFAKGLLSIPFFLKGVCSTLSLCFDSYSLKTMTELQTLIFLHFVQQINKTTLSLYGFIQRNKQHILNICSAAFIMLDEGRSIVSEVELATVVDENGIEPFGFIVKSNFNQHYKFVHPFLLSFCASVHLYFYGNPQKVFNHARLRSCLPAAFGLLNNGRNFFSLINQLQKPLYNKNIWLRDICGKQNLLLELS